MNNQSPPYHLHQLGFTMVEMVVAVFISTVIISAVFTLQNYIITQQQFTINSYLTVETANAAVQTLEREIKNSRQGANGAYQIAEASDQQLIIYSNADRDDDVERIRYFLDGTNFNKGVINPTAYPFTYPGGSETITTLNPHVRNGAQPIFIYYNGDWPTDTENNPLVAGNRLSNTRLIGVHLVVNSNQNSIETDHILDSYIQLRTLKDNL